MQPISFSIVSLQTCLQLTAQILTQLEADEHEVFRQGMLMQTMIDKAQATSRQITEWDSAAALTGEAAQMQQSKSSTYREVEAGGGIQSLQLAVAAPFGRQVVPSQQGPESIVLSQILCCTEWFARTLDSVLLSERDDCDPLMYACNGSVEGFQRANKVTRYLPFLLAVLFQHPRQQQHHRPSRPIWSSNSISRRAKPPHRSAFLSLCLCLPFAVRCRLFRDVCGTARSKATQAAPAQAQASLHLGCSNSTTPWLDSRSSDSQRST
ncbi:uncharacterized protein SEPMUDRAFT_114354 [Sphaerulina musiva SO2202]|uniref:Uncharacterized protein n=1 Tax=Sphaerulina musiva (strain SO2202) TaxID=692275 RepID=M3CN69_SPHMS|nr:uncharacterized protein SEPMUDRAFT_114354 [Sphaerulina musiva SO2202]EMF15238.1 hypothetical protein SEPMUDRAFT_114354 [Sphaerulina musiva SO2202]